MPPLNLNHLGGLLPMEASPSATGPPAIAPPQNGLFGQHLKQATQMAYGLVDVDRLPGFEPPRTQHDDNANRGDSAARPPNDVATQDRGPAGTPDDQATTTEPRSDRDQTPPPESSSEMDEEAGAGQSASPAEAGEDASESTSASGEEDDGKENGSQADEAPSGSLQAGAAGKVAVQDGDLGAKSTSKQSDAGRQGGSKPAVQRKDQPASGGRLPGHELDHSGRVGPDPAAEDNAAEAWPTEQAEPTRAQAAKGASGPAGQAAEVTAAETADGLSNGRKAPGSPLSDGSIRRPRTASDSRRQGSGDLLAAKPEDKPLTQPAPNTGPEATQRKPGADLPAVLPNEVEADAGKATADSTSSDPHGSQTAGPARVAPNQGSRQGSTSPSEGPSGPDQADRVRFVNRVARAFQSLGDRGGSIRLRLHPPELGSLRLELTVRNGTMAARLEVETASARNMLLDHLPALRERLAGQDIKVGRFDVDLTDRSPGGSPQRPSDHPQSSDHFNEDVPGSPPDPKGEVDPPAQPKTTVQTGEANRLDVII